MKLLKVKCGSCKELPASVKYAIGIDPGKSGAIVVMKRSGTMVIRKMPVTPSDIYAVLRKYKDSSYCYLEKVQGLPRMGGMAMFTFGRGFGWLQMALLALRIPTEEVRPQTWIKEFGLGVRGKMTKTAWKNKLKAKAQQLFPSIERMTLAISDAILIAEYGRRKLRSN